MSALGASSLRFGDLHVEGRSRAGEETWFRVRPPDIGLDVGRGPLRLVGASRFFLTHGHLDHVSGLPFLLSQRSLQELGATRVYCPRATVGALSRYVEASEELEAMTYDWRLEALDPGQRVTLGRGFEIEAFATRHVVPSLGYHLWKTTERLAAPYRGLPSERLVELKARGESISESARELWLSYVGDSGPEVFDLEPRLFEARVLLVECTFLDPAMRDRGRRFGHLHLADLVERRERFANEALILHHLSNRHRAAELSARLAVEMPELAERVHLALGEPEDGSRAPRPAAERR